MCHLTSLTKSATKNTFKVVFHPPGIVVEILDTEASDQGRSCEEHPINCVEVLEPDVVVRLRKVQLMVEGREETAIAAVWVTDGMDRCRVGFLPRHMVKHAARYDGSLVQVTRVLRADPTCCDLAERRVRHHNRGCCLATIISCLPAVSRAKGEEKDKDEIGEEEMTKRKHVV
jgi:hypothetical protein